MSEESDKGSKLNELSGFVSFWQELKRRKVMRVAIAYAIVGWLVMQIGAVVFPNLGIPQWVLSALILLVLMGFPIALVLAWAFKLTPDGIKTTKTAQEQTENS